MIGKIKNKNKQWKIELKLPFLNVPIKNILINSSKQALSTYSIKVKVSVMNEDEKEKFFILAKKNWAL